MEEGNNGYIKFISHKSVEDRARNRWDAKSVNDRLRASSKYKHIFLQHKLPNNDWSNAFNDLSVPQRNILIKGELIRSYDSLANRDKTKLKMKLGLSKFSSKWFRLLPNDKKILLNSVLHNG